MHGACCEDEGVDANKVGGELVDADGLLVKISFGGSEKVISGKAIKAISESVVVCVGGYDGFAENGRECSLVSLDPGLEVVETVVALCGDEEEPDGEHFCG